ncbi:Polysaccharide pyruvyl transferase [Halanaerobium saccharolyticum subsp. saccharolyticum DSM 6643]|uniref:Polysaccharide pyruvyl transferase n=1 Tax=Halanaerobium saccharolyticum subsp. saccharolyticum DSM 6643 TaxID=1293054 RepID=M5E4P0_9FIRM|nr:polysaccharide pyruvyl transferase family protein [Halanaerobium saccharolyticum]CCU80945.1 Polysaccharide pyruvyl transferase [Halanaerobium saccharolyticum subsp. saccharolyticum DSM 6643]
MNIAIIGMSGCGNLGDDLIAFLLINKVLEKWPKAKLNIITGKYKNEFGYPENSKIDLLEIPKMSEGLKYLNKRKEIIKTLKKTDIIILGGGGLLQDSHYFFTIHKWLKYIIETNNTNISLITASIGVGPLNNSFSKWYLNHNLSIFNCIQVRDHGSKDLLTNLNINSDVACDVVEGADLQEAFDFKNNKYDNILGCSIRPWPTLKFIKMVNFIDEIIEKEKIDKIYFFVFEHTVENIKEYKFAQKLSKELSREELEIQIYCYRENELDLFFDKFLQVSKAIAMRYHANILWQKYNIPVLPVTYAPKVTRFYEDSGFEPLTISELNNGKYKYDFININKTQKYELPIFNLKKDNNIKLKNYLIVKLINLVEIPYKILNGLKLRIKNSDV